MAKHNKNYPVNPDPGNPDPDHPVPAFPRALTGFERECLQYILPSEKKGYNSYRQKLESLFVIGYGRFGGSNLILGQRTDSPDLTIPSAPVFALGSIKYSEAEVYILLHEESENEIEFDISEVNGKQIPEELTEISKWTYSQWVPGKRAPEGSKVREIQLIPGKIVLAIANDQKRIWIFDGDTGINHFIPVTNFYNELIKIKKIKDPKVAMNSKLLFDRPGEFSDQEIGQAFLLYNKYWKKIELDYSVFINHSNSKIEKGHPFLNILKKRLSCQLKQLYRKQKK